MLKPWRIILELESDNSRLFKEGVIEKYNLTSGKCTLIQRKQDMLQEI